MSTPLLAALREARVMVGTAVTTGTGEATVARRLSREIDDAIARLEGTDVEKDLVSIVCHDLKDPLASIVMGAGFLKKTMAADESPTRRVVDAISRSADRMGQVVEDFHDLAKLRAGILLLELRPCEVLPILHGPIATLQEQARERGLVLTLEGACERPIAMCDRARLAQILSKLVGNALKFTPPGGKITVRVAEDTGKVRIAVSDTGRGISADRFSGLFDHSVNARRSPRDGPGLGLAIVRGIVELHRGEISVESRVGAGSTFTFTLPTA